MATVSKTSTEKPVHKLETETATIHFSGGLTHNSNSDSETPSEESESDNLSKTQNDHDENNLEESAGDKLCSDGEITAAGNDSTILRSKNHVTEDRTVQDLSGVPQSMVDSSDSGCPCSPFDKDTSVMETGKSIQENRTEATHLNNVPAKPSKLESDNEDISQNYNSKLPQHQHPASREGMSLDLTRNKALSKRPISSPERFNPFDKHDPEEQDPFPQLYSHQSAETSHDIKEKDDDSLSDDSWDEDDVKTETEKNPTEMELGMTEDYFSQPEGHFGQSSIEELEAAIDCCKQMVMEAETGTELKKNLVHKLVQLRLRLTEAQEKPSSPEEGVKHTVGHTFVLKDSRKSQRYCEQCNSVIWGVLHNWYRCTSCGFCCHEKCLDLVTRTCAIVKVAETPELILAICPEKSLASQNYKCAECRTPISFHSSQREPRQCDYTGLYYCDRCHWNDVMVIPARILHNWDFEPRKICRGTKQFLKLMRKKAVLRIQDINPMLFNFVEELDDVRKLREEILVMKIYFLSCKDALQSKLLLQLKDRQHFVENSHLYSVEDLLDIANDVLLPQLAKIHASFAQHIKTDCQLCQAKGYICELCDEKEVLFPFDNIAIVCSQCSSVLHRHCYMRRNQKCPKCSRTTPY